MRDSVILRYYPMFLEKNIFYHTISCPVLSKTWKHNSHYDSNVEVSCHSHFQYLIESHFQYLIESHFQYLIESVYGTRTTFSAAIPPVTWCGSEDKLIVMYFLTVFIRRAVIRVFLHVDTSSSKSLSASSSWSDQGPLAHFVLLH